MSMPLSYHPPTLDEVRRAPKALLHDHLDGGLRPATILDLAKANGVTTLPATDLAGLTEWFDGVAGSGSLERYLEAFDHTVAVLQTREALERVSRECVEDLAADGVVYAEVRYAPELSVAAGLELAEVVQAILDGFDEGMADAAARGKIVVVRLILCAMRQAARSVEIAQLAIDYRARGVAGFDIAGPEDGFPPSEHAEAFDLIARANGHFTIHAGEAFGLPSIWEALQVCHADRLGHGVRIFDDLLVAPDGRVELGPLAEYVRDMRVPLEMCPSSNVHTGAVASFDEHPMRMLRELQFRVTVNTDNRLMSGCTLSSEMYKLVTEFGYGWRDLQWLTINAMKSAFYPFDKRLEMINRVIKPGFMALSGLA